MDVIEIARDDESAPVWDVLGLNAARTLRKWAPWTLVLESTRRRAAAMHVPDGFIDLPTSAATGAVAVTGIGLALRQAREELEDRMVPMAGLVAAFVFAGQMMNFPVGAGTSGHLLGGTLAAVLVGPWTGMLCIGVVLLVQGLFMADGGISALGTNITLMAMIGTGVGYVLFRGVSRMLPRRTTSVPFAAAAGALVSVPVTAAAFTVLFALGGTLDVSTSKVLTAMVGWHIAIGIGESVITGLVVSAVGASRPDLVYGARVLARRRELVRQGVVA